MCSIEQYYHKRKAEYVDEALAYDTSVEERFGRRPVPRDFWEEFPLFHQSGEELDGVPIHRQIDSRYESYTKRHELLYEGFEDILKAADVSSWRSGK